MELSYWKMGTQFLQLSEAASGEIIGSGNPTSLVSDHEASDAELEKHYRWADHSIGVAVLFNLLHGIELILKGFICVYETPAQHHRLSQLLQRFSELYPGEPLMDALRPILVDREPGTPLARFLEQNGVSMDEWYQFLKYPVSTRGQHYDHLDLKYGGKGAVPYRKLVNKTAKCVRRESVTLARSRGLA